MARVEIRVRNVDCENEAAAIRRGLSSFPGLSDLQVYAKAGKVAAQLDGVGRERLEERLAELGFPPERAEEGPPSVWRNPKVVASLASGALMVAGWGLERAGLPRPVVVATYVVGGYYFGREALADMVHEQRVGIELLMSAAAAAALLGAPGEGAMLAFLYSISEAAEGYTEEKARAAVRALMKLSPRTAIRLRGGREEEVPVEELAVDDIFVVKPGQAAPTDGVVLKGASEVNQAPVTGESAPVPKEPGSQVFAASLNGDGALEVRATRAFADSTLSRVMHLVEEAQEQKGRSQRFIERFGNVYSPLVLGAGVLLGLVPFVLGAAEPREWLARATVFVVAAALCALVISIPITMVAALSTGARQGVLVKGGRHLEELARVRVVAFDNTGTLTMGRPTVTDVLPVAGAGLAAQDALAVAAAVERRSTRPLATAIVAHAERLHLPGIDLAEAQAIQGGGASGRWDGRLVYAGSLALFKRLGPLPEEARLLASALEEAGKSVVVVGEAGRPWLILGARDQVRPGAAAAVRLLRNAGIERVAMLSGDHPRAAPRSLTLPRPSC